MFCYFPILGRNLGEGQDSAETAMVVKPFQVDVLRALQEFRDSGALLDQGKEYRKRQKRK